MGKGIEIGQEIGFFLGFSQTWLKKLEDHPPSEERKKIGKVVTSLQKLKDLAEKFPKDNLKDVDVVEKLNVMRSTFKLICSLLKISSDYTRKTTAW